MSRELTRAVKERYRGGMTASVPLPPKPIAAPPPPEPDPEWDRGEVEPATIEEEAIRDSNA